MVIPGLAAETAVKGGAGIDYTSDDNIQVSPENQILLSGWTVDGFLNARYSTPRFEAAANVELGVERYDDADLDSSDPLFKDPKGSDFDNESLDVKADVSYEWERHTLSFMSRYSRDSTLNTQFIDTGFAGLRELQGTTRREITNLRPAWQWSLTERQRIDTQLQWQRVEYQSSRFIDYDYASVIFNWSYALSERVSLQVVPIFSNYQNKADAAVESDTLGLQGGFIWAASEKLRLNILVGGSQVSTDYGVDGFFAFDPDTGEVVFFEIEDDDGNSFTGDVSMHFDEEYYGFSVNVLSAYSPSGDGTLSQTDKGRIKLYWKPRERMKLDVDAVIGRNENSDDQINIRRDFFQFGIRYGYQFRENWWLSTLYRYRENENKRSGLGEGHGNLITFGVSYRLPEEIF